MPIKFNPLLKGGFDETKRIINDLEDVNTAGTVNGDVLTFQSGTWIPQTAAGGGDMTRAVYDVNDNDIVDNSERLEGETLATVQAHGVDAGTITQGTIGLARVPVMDDAHIPNLPTSKITSGTFNALRIPTLPNLIGTLTDVKIPDVNTLSYSATFADAQIPDLWAGKITSGTFNVDRIPALPNLVGTLTDEQIPNLEGLSYGAAFATTQIPNLPTSKITSGTLAVARHQILDNLNGTVDLVQIPTMDDAHIPYLDTLSYSAAFGTAQIPSLGAYKVASGTINADRIPDLPTVKITSGTFDNARIPDTGVVAINYVIDGGGAAIGTGIKGALEVPFACHVNRWTLLADQHGSIVVDVWRDSYANFPPTDADSMPGTTNMPAISGTIAAQSSDLSGWGTQGIASGDILWYHVDSCSSIELCTIALRAIKT